MSATLSLSLSSRTGDRVSGLSSAMTGDSTPLPNLAVTPYSHLKMVEIGGAMLGFDAVPCNGL